MALMKLQCIHMVKEGKDVTKLWGYDMNSLKISFPSKIAIFY